VDDQMHAAMQAKAARHQRSRRWALLGRSRCRDCGMRWPCLARDRARRALDGAPSTPDWATLGTQPQIAVSPLLTYGQRYRSCGDAR